MEPSKPSPGERVLVGAFGVCFGGVGVAVIAFMWGMSSGGFGSPPLFFRVVASLIAVPFVAFGATALNAAVTGRASSSLTAKARERAQRMLHQAEHAGIRDSQSGVRGSYACPHCAAPLGDGADVSPSGDVKCPYCRSWFNVHHG